MNSGKYSDTSNGKHFHLPVLQPKNAISFLVVHFLLASSLKDLFPSLLLEVVVNGFNTGTKIRKTFTTNLSKTEGEFVTHKDPWDERYIYRSMDG